MNLHFNEATIAKMTVKQVLNQVNHIEILVALGEPSHSVKATLEYWFEDLRIHLQRLETIAEQAVH